MDELLALIYSCVHRLSYQSRVIKLNYKCVTRQSFNFLDPFKPQTNVRNPFVQLIFEVFI